MAYKRTDAVSFADTHWNIPADDGIFWLSNQSVSISQVRLHNVIPTSSWKKAPVGEGWQPFFVDDGGGGEKAVFRRVVSGTTEEILINSWDGIADCAHFLSRCISAGGVKMNERGVPSLVNTLQSLPNTKTLCEKVVKEAGQRVIDSGVFKPGDMVGYFNIDPAGDYGGAKQYSHSAMYAGKIGGKTDGGITCHTICRFPGRSWVEDSWWLKPPGHYTYTLIHFSDDDPTPDPVKAAALPGWWQLDYAGRTEYYLMRSGSVTYTKKAPTTGQTTVHLPEGTAYWFMAPNGEITFTWRKSGTVEVWTPAGSGYTSKINGATPGVLTKLF
ncbi:MAG: hypothetical protein DMG78_01790 [Acidobacteria bacterium]|nr:MAG: hypothetical protein DMG78_01790 [Acidobacteriota bacterium]